MAAATEDDGDFPHSLTALRSLAVDEELSALVKRDFQLVSGRAAETDTPDAALQASGHGGAAAPTAAAAPAPLAPSTDRGTDGLDSGDDERDTVLRVHYRATTARMLRVAVNGFFESLGVVMQVMEELDVDVLHEDGGLEGLEGVQGVEQGMTGTAVGVAGG